MARERREPVAKLARERRQTHRSLQCSNLPRREAPKLRFVVFEVRTMSRISSSRVMTGRILRVWETFQNYDLGESEAFQSGFFRLRTAQQCLGWTLVFQSLSPKENEGSRKPILFFRNCQVSLVFQTICLTFLKNILQYSPPWAVSSECKA